MFLVRSTFWLGIVVLLLPASPDGEPAPRVSLVHTAYAARILVEDMSGLCSRHPDACEKSRQALILLKRKLETGAGIVSAGLVAGQEFVDPAADHGTLTAADLEPLWSAAEMR